MKKFFSLLFVFSLLIFASSHFMPIRPPGTMIILNGTSSAGKSSMLRVLPNILEGSWKTIEADSFVFDSIARLIDHISSRFGIKTSLDGVNDVCIKLVAEGRLTQEEIDDFFGSTFDQVFEKTKEYFQAGHKVILDWCILEESEEDGDVPGFSEYFNALRTSNVALVLAYCPFATLIERVRRRNEEGGAEEQRDYHVPIQYFYGIFKAAQPGETPILGTLTRAEVIGALETYAKGEFEDKEKYEKFKSKTLKDLSLDRYKSIQVTPRLKYDLIVNTGIHSTVKCARQIRKFLDSGHPFTAMRENARKLGLTLARPAKGILQRFKNWLRKILNY